jgi:hypothetical protein
MITDEEFREQHKPLHVPSAYEQAKTIIDKIVFALADIGEGTADAVIRHLEELEPTADQKPLIAATRELLTALYNNGHIAGHEENGDLIYNLHKITQANDGAVNPDLLAPGLD